MKPEQIFKQLDEMLQNPKAKGFLNHIIRSYIPVTNVTKVVERPKEEFRCLLTRVPLQSLDDIMAGLNELSFMNDFKEFCSVMFEKGTDTNSPIANLVGERKLAVTGTETSTYMSYDAYRVFLEWITNKLVLGDKHISWMIKSMRTGQDESMRELYPDRPAKVQVPKVKEATYTLGEVGAFKELMAKFQ